MAYPHRTLGTGDAALTVSAMGLGCMGMSEFYGTGDEDESVATIHAALDAGVDLLDTADMYGPFTNERFVGARSPAGATKSCSPPSSATSATPTAPGSVSTAGRSTWPRPRTRRSSASASTNRPLLPAPGRPQGPHRRDMGGHGELVQAGKVRHLGISEAAPETIRRAHSHPPHDRPANGVVALDPRRRGRRRARHGARARDRFRGLLAARARVPLGRPPQPRRPRPRRLPADDPRFQGDNFAKNLELVDRVKQVADQRGVKPGQVALAWVLAQGDDVVPIPGPSGAATSRRTSRPST